MERKITVIPASRQKSGPRTTRAGQQRVATYCRVSTDHEEQLGSFANQVEYYTNLINSKPEWTMAGLFSDAADIIGLNQNPFTEGNDLVLLFLIFTGK